ncbi:hypothetical protein AWE51_03170 [Aquimarina aggregata]|uniref:Carboxypeptidase regulatory-like domain-containing protein n=1 Tax=Aquimarina aggregata TaxID=1642818 RepID=A0A162DM29_9FLAO|nr:hypothetical protein [Aquimarina aggregata]KZS42458.1 hypothetical protein AWE51_03170 [Aquimarina aggregata]
MGFILKGNLTGEICKDCKEPLFGSIVRFYRVENLDIDVVTQVSANPKDTLQILGEKQIKAKSKLLLAEAEIDEKGNYEIELKGKYAEYDGPIMIDIVTKRVYNQKSKDRDSIQFTLTTLQPRWRQTEQGVVFYWKHCINSRFWCRIRELFDAWVICGVLLDCKNDNIPIPGVKVIAMDDDWIHDDELGSDTTNSNGHFRIDYSSKDFKQTFLSPLINIETPFPPFNSGPDVYFKLEYNGSSIEFEKPSDKRNNVGPCLCVRLCLEEIVITEIPIPASFTNIGLTRRIKIQDEINTANGKTLRAGFNEYAFYNTINLIGTITQKLNGNQMEYMFEYQEVGAPNNIPISGGWLPVTPDMIPPTTIGNHITLTGDPSNPVLKTPYITDGIAPDINFNGNWIPVPEESNFEPHQDTTILKLNTVSLTNLTSLNMASPTSDIGTATVSAGRPHTRNRYFAIRMKQRELNNIATEVIAGTSKPIAIFNVEYNNVNKHGNWAPDIKNNQRASVSVNIDEIVSATTGCNKITNALHVKYHARNENLSSVSLSITGPKKPGQNFGFAAIPLMLAPETYGSAQLINLPESNPISLFDVNDLLPCAYTVHLSAKVKLTTGDGEPGPIQDFISFCKV